MTCFLGHPPSLCPTQKLSRSPALSPAPVCWAGPEGRAHTSIAQQNNAWPYGQRCCWFAAAGFLPWCMAPLNSSHPCLGWSKLVAISKLSFKKILTLAIGQVAAQGPLGCIFACKYWPQGTNYAPLPSQAHSNPCRSISLLIFISVALSVPCP